MIKRLKGKIAASLGALNCQDAIAVAMLVVLSLMTLLYYPSTYQTMDDLAMRIALDGTAFEYGGKNMPFVVYMSPLYGGLLAFLYSIVPGAYWYDVFQFSLTFGAGIVIVLLVFRMMPDMKPFEKTICCVAMAVFMSVFTIQPQFTITAGCLAVAAAMSLVYAFTRRCGGHAVSRWVYGYSVVAAAFSSLIRFDCFVLVFAFTSLLLMPHWFSCARRIKHEWRNGIFCAAVLALVVVLKVIGDIAVLNNPEWNEISEMNKLRVEICDKTDMWDNISEPWRSMDTDFVKEALDSCDFKMEDYRLLLSAFWSGNRGVNNVKTIKPLVKMIRKSVQKGNHAFRFEIKDWSKVFVSILLAFVFLFVTLGKRVASMLFIACSFFLLICCLNCFFRAIPPRLWYPLAFAAFVALLAAPGKQSTWQSSPAWSSVRHVAYVAFILSSLSFIKAEGEKSRWIHSGIKAFQSELKDIAKSNPDKVYFADHAVAELLGRPFSSYRPNRYGVNMVVAHPLLFSKEADLQLEKYGISPVDTIMDITKSGSRARFLLTGRTWMQPFEATMKSIGFYLRKKGFSAVAYFKPIKEGVTYEARISRDLPFLYKKWRNHLAGFADGEDFDINIEFVRFMNKNCPDFTSRELKEIKSRLFNMVVLDDNYKIK